MTDPFGPPEPRTPSAAPLVDGIRTAVDSWRSGGYPGVSATTRELLTHWFLDEHQTTDGSPFRYYFAQREAVETIIYLHEVERLRTLPGMLARFATVSVASEGQPYPRYVVKAATGSGKTKVMSLLIAWAYFHHVREPDSPLTGNALVVAPNLIVYERLRSDFEHARIFADDPVVPAGWTFDLQVTLRNDPLPAAGTSVLVLTNVQALYERPIPEPADPVSALLGPTPPASLTTPDPVLNRLAERGPVMVVNDEAHHLHEAISRDTGDRLTVWRTLERLHEISGGIAAQLDFSATPRGQGGTLFPDIVSDYPLAAAIAQGIVKRPIIGEIGGAVEQASDDASVRYRKQLQVGVAKWRDFRGVLGEAGQKPLLFVMAEDTKAADQIAAYLETLSDLAGSVLTIHVNMRGPNTGEITRNDLEMARAAARRVDSDDNPYHVVVSVLMLREGWDVRNVSVIVPLRPFTARAQILPEQTLGRGLRRMTPPGSGVDEQVVVIEHEAFRELWDAVIDDEGLDIDRLPVDDIRPNPVVITVEPDKLVHDIEIPQLARTLTRDSGALGGLRAEDVPERILELPGELRNVDIDYTGRDLLSGEVVDRATYPTPQADQPEPVLAWYTRELARLTQLTGQFAVLAPLIRGYVEERVFGGPVDFADPLVLQALAEPAAQEVILGALRQAVDQHLLVAQTADAVGKPLLLSRTRPFLWSGQVAAGHKSVFSGQPCDSGLEMRLCAFLDRCPDVESFAKLAVQVRFSLEYRAEEGRLAYYYPDFVVRRTDGQHLVVETKGLADADVPHKDARVSRWTVDATTVSGVRWSYLRVDQDVFDQHEPRLSGLWELVDVVFENRRQALLRDRSPARRRDRSEVLSLMDRVRQQTRGVTGVDEEIARLREDPRG